MKQYLASASLIPAMLLAACAPQSPASQVSNDPPVCNQGNYDWLLGSDINALPTDSLPDNRRVFDTGMKVTQDHAKGRLNLVYDAASGSVIRVYCG